MESPPSLEAAPLSEDSGLIVTSGSFSSDSGLLHISSELQESDYDEKSLSQYDSQDASEQMYGDNFNTVKKGPVKIISTTIEPPSQFQDRPRLNLSSGVSLSLSKRAELTMTFEGSKTCDRSSDWRQSVRRYNAPRLLHLSPCHSSVRPSSRSSLQTSRLSSSHNSLTTQTETDDSSFITQAISHDTLSIGTSDIADMYNVPFDSDIYTVPIDSVRPSQASAFQRSRNQNSLRNNRLEYTNVVNDLPLPPRIPITSKGRTRITSLSENKRHSIPGTSWTNKTQSAMKFTEIDSIIVKPKITRIEAIKTNKVTISPDDSRKVNNNNVSFNSLEENLDRITDENIESNNNLRKSKKNMFTMRYNKKHKDNAEEGKSEEQKMVPVKKSPARNLSLNFKQTLCNLFRLKKTASVECSDDESSVRPTDSGNTMQKVAQRALPSVPQTPRTDAHHKEIDEESNLLDFPKSIQIVKDYGWYWGPISVEASEKLLSTEPDGSFILRDSSDDHYIFTISFKLNGGVRHVRIEHDQGKFCFGSCTMFKARTIVEFIENAVETSRSGRYLFFLNLRPVLGPVRVQLLYPVSRYKRVQSLQHMCRFVILKYVRRDLIDELRLPRRLIDYLSTPQYYSECLSES